MLVMKKTLESSRDSIDKIDSYFIKHNGTVEVIESIESLAKLSGVNIDSSSVSVDASSNKENYTETIRMVVDFDGSWKESSSFLFLIENAPFKVSIERVRIYKDESLGGWFGEIEFTALKLKE